MLPVIVPIVQVKLLDIEAFKLMFGLVPLQMAAVLGVKTTGVGFTVTVIGNDAQDTAVKEVGVTI